MSFFCKRWQKVIQTVFISVSFRFLPRSSLSSLRSVYILSPLHNKQKRTLYTKKVYCGRAWREPTRTPHRVAKYWAKAGFMSPRLKPKKFGNWKPLCQVIIDVSIFGLYWFPATVSLKTPGHWPDCLLPWWHHLNAKSADQTWKGLPQHFSQQVSFECFTNRTITDGLIGSH